METRYQRVAREQAERQHSRHIRELERFKAEQKEIRRQRKIQREGARERRYLETLIRD